MAHIQMLIPLTTQHATDSIIGLPFMFFIIGLSLGILTHVLICLFIDFTVERICTERNTNDTNEAKL